MEPRGMPPNTTAHASWGIPTAAGRAYSRAPPSFIQRPPSMSQPEA